MSDQVWRTILRRAAHGSGQQVLNLAIKHLVGGQAGPARRTQWNGIQGAFARLWEQAA